MYCRLASLHLFHPPRTEGKTWDLLYVIQAAPCARTAAVRGGITPCIQLKSRHCIHSFSFYMHTQLLLPSNTQCRIILDFILQMRIQGCIYYALKALSLIRTDYKSWVKFGKLLSFHRLSVLYEDVITRLLVWWKLNGKSWYECWLKKASSTLQSLKYKNT